VPQYGHGESEADRSDDAETGVEVARDAMREYVTVPDVIRESPSALRLWLTKARTYAISLPPKKKR
jgi:hypothetical protein